MSRVAYVIIMLVTPSSFVLVSQPTVSITVKYLNYITAVT